MASVSGGSIEDVLSAVNSADFEDIVGPLDNELTQNAQKATSLLQVMHSESLLTAEQGNSAAACTANASLLKNQLVLNKVGATADVHTSQGMNNPMSVSPVTMVHFGSHLNVAPGVSTNLPVGPCGGQALLANAFANPHSIATSAGDVQNILKANVLTNGPTLVTLNADPAAMVVPTSSSTGHTVTAVNGGLQLGATNAMYNLAKIAAEQQPLVISAQNAASNGSPVAVTSAVPVTRTLSTLPGGVAQKQPYIANSDIKMDKGEDKGSSQPTAAVPLSPHTITVVRNLNPASIAQPVTQQLQIVNQGKAVLQQGSVRIQVPPVQQMQMLAPRPGANTITLPQGFNIPPGAVLMKNEQGQIVIMQGVPRQVLAAMPNVSTVQGVQQQVLAAVRNAQQSGQQQQQPSPQMISALRPGIMPGQSQLVQASTVSGQQVILRPGSVLQATPQQLQQHFLSQQVRVQMPQAAAPVLGQLQQQSVAIGKPQPQLVQRSPADVENVQKCKNFLSTLIKLATQQAPATITNVRNLIQGLIDGLVQPEEFTAQLQQELKSSPQPGLVSFLKKSLPLLRDALRKGELQIEGVRLQPNNIATPLSGASPTILPATVLQMHTGGKTVLDTAALKSSLQLQQQQATAKRGQPMLVSQQLQKVAAARGSTLLPTSATQHQQLPQLQQREPSPSPKKQKLGLQEDDDINDVAAMGGVNLSEESKNILATTNADAIGSQHRSCKDEYFLITSALSARIHAAAVKKGLREVAADVISLISHATQERLRHIAEKLSLLSEHRLELPKMDPRCEPCGSDVRTQLRFLEELDRLERKRHEDEERERLLRAAKSRSKHEDPEQARLKAKAKELQEAEMEEMRKRDANITALAAIGPRKKRRPDDSPGGTGGSSFGTSGASGSGSAGTAVSSATSAALGVAPLRQRTKRVNLRDLIFVMEQDKEVAKSTALYKAYLK